jgi:DNA polymerase-3 subunit alpha
VLFRSYSNARPKYDVEEFYLKSRKEIETFFARNYGYDFAKEICDNTIYFANMCEQPEWIDPKFSNPHGKELPTFPIENEGDYKEFLNWLSLQVEGIRSLDKDKAFLRFRCEKAFEEKVPKDKEKEYRERLEEELDVLYYCGVSSYMLITADYINWCRKNGVTVGPGRGSAGGCLVAYLLDIHRADSIKYGLVFARFHNKLKKSYSDIDSDFSKENREKVIEYITNKYGADRVAQISNNIYITPKVYVKDISRSLELGGSREDAVKLGNEIADAIPKRVDEKEVRTFNEAVDKSPLFCEYIKRYPDLKKYSAICNKPRAAGVHASGILISNRPINDIIPTRMDKEGGIVSEFDKDRVEDAGLVKMDILGLETLDIIDRTNKLIKDKYGSFPEINYDRYDKKTYDLITSGDTFGVFQFGSSAGTIELCKRIDPKNIEDLAIITTIARPSSRDIRDDFIKTKFGELKVKYLHPILSRALSNTYGFSIYDESLLILAKDVAGWDLAEADKLRKLTKEKGKNPKKVNQWRNEFIDGAQKNGLKQKEAIEIWDKIIEPFGKYSFNKSHAILYSMISYHTAYLKAHYPIEFLLANLMSEVRSNNAKAAKGNIEKIKQELRNRGIKILPPDINKSSMAYKLIDNNTILTGLDALKVVGDDAIKDMISKRPFKDFNDFMVKCEPRKVGASAIKALVSTGSIDCFNIPRRLIFVYASDYRKKLQVWLKRHDPNKEQFEYPWPIEKDWAISELYALEKKYLGEALICNKRDAFGDFFKSTKNFPISELQKLENKTQIPIIKAEVKNIFEFKVKKAKSKYFGQPMIKATIEDEYNTQCNITLFPDTWKTVKSRMKELYKGKYKFDEGIAIHFAGTVNIYENEHGIILDNLFNFVPEPLEPKDLTSKKVSIKRDKEEEDIKEGDIFSSEDMIQSFEDDLYQRGHIDLEDDDEDSY